MLNPRTTWRISLVPWTKSRRNLPSLHWKRHGNVLCTHFPKVDGIMTTRVPKLDNSVCCCLGTYFSQEMFLLWIVFQNWSERLQTGGCRIARQSSPTCSGVHYHFGSIYSRSFAAFAAFFFLHLMLAESFVLNSLHVFFISSSFLSTALWASFLRLSTSPMHWSTTAENSW